MLIFQGVMALEDFLSNPKPPKLQGRHPASPRKMEIDLLYTNILKGAGFEAKPYTPAKLNMVPEPKRVERVLSF